MLKDSERYILTTAKASVIRDVLSLVFAAVKSDADGIPDTSPSLETFVKSGCDRMILELRRPKESPAGVSPGVRNLRVSRLGRVLVVTGKATAPGILREIEALRRPRFFPEHLASGLVAPVRTLFHTLRLAHPQN
ncbi:MAG: hypothetical protein P8Z30_09280 [Acidobacteriota bacterium]